MVINLRIRVKILLLVLIFTTVKSLDIIDSASSSEIKEIVDDSITKKDNLENEPVLPMTRSNESPSKEITQSSVNVNSESSSSTTSSSSKTNKTSEASIEDSNTTKEEVIQRSAEREEYYYWIKFKNSFTYDKDQKAKLARSFKPETSGYVSSSLGKPWFIYLLAGIFGAFLILYLVGRFVMNKFKGPKSHIGPWFSRVSWIFIFLGLVCVMVFYSITLSKSLKIK